MPIITSTYTVDDHTQADGSVWVYERHIDHTGKVHTASYLAPNGFDMSSTLSLRAENIGAAVDAREAAETESINFALPVSKVAWRRRFTAAEQDAIDAFNAGGYLTHPTLDEATKGAIRRGLVLYEVTADVNPLDPDTQALLGLYEALGLLSAGRAAEIGVG